MEAKQIVLRPSQERIIAYTSGKMGIAAVPGSGKTWTLSMLAAKLILSGALGMDQEVLVVTLVNSAVDNFSQRISERLKESGLLPGMSYRVRTLHGLAHDIVRERPDLAGLSNDFNIIDEREANSIKTNVAETFLHIHPEYFDRYLKDDLSDYQREKIHRVDLLKLTNVITNDFIRSAKDNQLSPQALRSALEKTGGSLPLVEMGVTLYEDYQQALNYRGGVDFDDLIRLALQCLRYDPELVTNLQNRWPYILEDEAQDSSHLQQEILSLLSGENGNWVRVGDPNQAIYETFTTADPRLLRDFLNRADVISEDLPESGRSTRSIISLANYLIDWTCAEHFNESIRGALSLPHIKSTSKSDPQPNPDDCPEAIHFIEQKLNPGEEVNFVVNDVQEWLTDHPNETVAILVPRNTRGFEVVDLLKQKGVEVIDGLLNSAASTRLSAGAIANILRYLSDPQSAAKLATAFRVWRRADRSDAEVKLVMEKASKLIKKCPRVEDYLWPSESTNWLSSLDLEAENPLIYEYLVNFREVIQRWQKGISLPIDQLILTIAQDLFLDPTELAMAHKLAVTLRQMQNIHPDWQLPELGEELKVIAKNERRFLGFSEDETGFNPDKYRGQIVVATMHKAKGLEWDKVYLMAINNYNFPSGNEYDDYYSEKWFIKNELNMEAEALAQLNTLVSPDSHDIYKEGDASLKARLEYIRERLRLLYVGITRARKALTITWNTGRRGDSVEAIPLVALRTYWKGLGDK